jgi:hypothetical protein
MAWCEAVGTEQLLAEEVRQQVPPKTGQSNQRSWTQYDLDNAIRQYKAKHSAQFREIAEGVRNDLPGAHKAAQRLFGRNVIARELCAKSATMVSKSEVWQEIAIELRLPRKSKKSPTLAGSKCIGFNIALEEEARQEFGTSEVLNTVFRNETIWLLRKELPVNEAEQKIEQFERGEITDDQARELVKLCRQQRQDNKARRVRPSP